MAQNLFLTPLDYYALYDGNVYPFASVTAPQVYLQQGIRESGEDYADRAAKTVYDPWAKRVVDIYVAYSLNGAKAEEREGAPSIYQFTRELLLHSYVGGYCYVLVLPSGPKVYPCIIDGWAIGANTRTYPAESIVENVPLKVWKFGEGRRKFEVRFPAADWDSGEAIGALVEYDGDAVLSTTTIQADQWIRMSWNPMESSLIKDVSRLAIQIFNLQSLYDYAGHNLGYYYKYGPPIEGGKQPVSGQYIAVDAGMQTPGVMAWADPGAVKVLGEIIDSKVRKLAQGVGLMDEFAEEVTIQSGVSKAVSLTKIAAVVASMADAANAAANMAFEAWGRLNNQAKVPNIQLSREVKPDARESDLDFLTKSADFVQDPEYLYEARRQAVMLGTDGVSSERVKEIMASLGKTGRVMPQFDPLNSFRDVGMPPAGEMEPDEEGEDDEEETLDEDED